jgi:ABC-type transport system involved in multi-copper enzyme maturation permease subunit
MLMLVSAIPVFGVAALFGGVTGIQLGRLFVVTAAAALSAASIATTVAFWKDTTFQAVAITAFALVAWIVTGEAVTTWFGPRVGEQISPARAMFAALSPAGGNLSSFLSLCGLIILGTNLVAIRQVRSWNMARDARRAAQARGTGGSTTHRPTRNIWQNPILWREICTNAYGRTIVIVRLAWMILFAAAVAGIMSEARAESPDRFAVAVAVIPMALASLLAVTALAVTSITTERDRGSLDLLLVSDLEPKEFIWGKLFGALAVAREVVVLPLLLCVALIASGIASVENGCYLLLGTAILLFFAAVLGIHIGLSYPSSRRAIAVGLGTVAFLFIGVATAMRIMVAFGSSFELQLAPFLAVIVGGGIGLYAALSARNPSPAIGWASAILPALTFVGITGFLQGNTLQVLLVVAVAYGFTTVALLVPAIGAFDLLTGRSSIGDA